MMTFAEIVASHASATPGLTWGSGLALGLTAFVAGAINSVAGGGTFLTVPMMIFCGFSEFRANTTNTVALWFGSLASVGAYRNQLKGQKHALMTMLAPSIIGSLLGSLILLRTPDSTFKILLPWLLLVATLIFIFGKYLTALLRRMVHLDINQPQHMGPFIVGFLLQFIIAVYGGFFGGGIGILMLALLTLLGYEQIHIMNGLKTVLATTINAVAVVAFVIADVVDWPQALVMIIGSIAGGYGGATIAQRVPAGAVRYIVMAVGISMTIYFFAR